jgi:hypothetical protein
MIFWGTPILGNLRIYIYICIHVYIYISYHVLNYVAIPFSPSPLAEASGESGIEDVLTQRGTSWDTDAIGISNGKTTDFSG